MNRPRKTYSEYPVKAQRVPDDYFGKYYLNLGKHNLDELLSPNPKIS